MKLVDKKTRKALKKSVKKIMKKHGPELAAALAGGALSRKLTDALASDTGPRSRKTTATKTAKKKGRRVREDGEDLESKKAAT